MFDDIGMTDRLDDDGIAHVVFDRPGEKVNLLTPKILRELDRLLDRLRGLDEVRGVLFESAKAGTFIAGMDVQEIAAVNDAFQAAEGARFGQSVFQKIEDLGKPSACAINGACLGGATELALACTFRLAADDPAVRIGLPEVRIGIIPGFGGTQRLPRLIGLASSLDMILSGRGLPARQARRLGLVDAVIPTAYLQREAVRLLVKAAADPEARLRRARPLISVALEKVAPIRRLVLSRARKRTARKVRPADYPAPFRALEAVEAAFSRPIAEGFDLEATLVGELVPTATSKNLIWLFKNQTALKRDAGGIQAPPRKIRRVAVVGAGVMGGGISHILADQSLPVRLRDVRQEALLSALRTASGEWERRVARKRISTREAYRKMAFIAPALDATGLRHVDLVIEAVVENLEVKQRVLAEAEERIRERAVFASNTSSIPISEIAAKALHPERVVGLHFFNPVHRMPLVEIVAGQRSSPEALATAHDVAIQLGKTPVIVRDSPGFLVNRILMLYLNEAMHLLAEGLKIEALDAAMTAFGMPLGPFALLDQVGLDTSNHVAGILHGAFGRRIGNSAPVLGAMVSAGKLGLKNGKGFYRYRGGRPVKTDPEVYNVAGAPSPRDVPPETLQERLVLAMVAEAAVCLEDALVRDARDVDIAMVMGTGFPAFRGGLLRHADAIGIPVVVDRLSRLADAHGERFRPCALLQEMVREQRRFYETP